MEVFVVILIFLAIGGGIAWRVYTSTSHSSSVEGMLLKREAAIIDCKSENVGGRHINDCAIRTTVVFSDGFKFISHKSSFLPSYGIGAHYVGVDALLLEEIKGDALTAHAKAFEKQERRKGGAL